MVVWVSIWGKDIRQRQKNLPQTLLGLPLTTRNGSWYVEIETKLRWAL